MPMPVSSAVRRSSGSVSWPAKYGFERAGKTHLREIARLQNEPVSHGEIEKVQMQLRRQRATQLYSTRSRANALGISPFTTTSPS
jgi:hypothetical protein